MKMILKKFNKLSTSTRQEFLNELLDIHTNNVTNINTPRFSLLVELKAQCLGKSDIGTISNSP